MSLAIHVSVIAVLFLAGSNEKVQTQFKDQVALIAPNMALYEVTLKRNRGGGGGDRSPTPPSRGKLPKLVLRQFVPPTAVVRNESPKLMEPTLVIQPDPDVPKTTMDALGDPLLSPEFLPMALDPAAESGQATAAALDRDPALVLRLAATAIGVEDPTALGAEFPLRPCCTEWNRNILKKLARQGSKAAFLSSSS